MYRNHSYSLQPWAGPVATSQAIRISPRQTMVFTTTAAGVVVFFSKNTAVSSLFSNNGQQNSVKSIRTATQAVTCFHSVNTQSSKPVRGGQGGCVPFCYHNVIRRPLLPQQPLHINPHNILMQLPLAFASTQ